MDALDGAGRPAACRYCGAPLPRATGRNGLPRYYCNPSHRAADCLRRRLIRLGAKPQAHRRRTPRSWEVADFAALPDEFKAVQGRRVDRALREGRIVPGIKIVSQEEKS